MTAKNIKPLMERRQAFAERQAKRGVGSFTEKEPMGTGPENRHRMPKLPVGQRETKGHWPVLDLGDVPEIPRAEWRLTIGGLVDMPHTYTWEEFLALPQTENASDFHCVTGWSMMDSCWAGVRFADLAERVGVQHDARCVFVTAYDIAPGSDTSSDGLAPRNRILTLEAGAAAFVDLTVGRVDRALSGGKMEEQSSGAASVNFGARWTC